MNTHSQLRFSHTPTSYLLLLAWLALSAGIAGGQEPAATLDWTFTSVDSVGGHKTTVIGTPRLTGSPPEQALDFDGASAIFLDFNPLAGLKQFTAEVIFRPAAGGPKEQRFVHFQENGSENRLLFEIRLIEGDRWFLDTFIKSGGGNCTLFAEKFPHPLGAWYHAAVVMDGQTMRHYVSAGDKVNGTEEMSTPITFMPQGPGQTSLGVRINKVSWYQGALRRLRITPRPLATAQFLKPSSL